MRQFWSGFEKRANFMGQAVGKFSRGGQIPIPGMRSHPPSANIIPGHGAVAVSKKMSIKPISQSSRGLPETPT
jgi:hypothetical protein